MSPTALLHSLLFVLGVLLFGIALTAAPTQAVTDDGNDRSALVALYNATDGPNWEINDNWLSDRPIGEWSGVNVDFNGRVKEMNFYDNRMTGPLPAELGMLSKLEVLNIRANRLSGADTL